MGNIVLISWFCLSLLSGLMYIGFVEAGNKLAANIFGILTLLVFLGLMFLYFIISDKEKQ